MPPSSREPLLVAEVFESASRQSGRRPPYLALCGSLPLLKPRGLALNPSLAEAHNNMGIALGALGRLEQAASQFRLALEIDPDHPDAQRNLSMLESLPASQPPR